MEPIDWREGSASSVAVEMPVGCMLSLGVAGAERSGQKHKGHRQADVECRRVAVQVFKTATEQCRSDRAGYDHERHAQTADGPEMRAPEIARPGERHQDSEHAVGDAIGSDDGPIDEAGPQPDEPKQVAGHGQQHGCKKPAKLDPAAEPSASQIDDDRDDRCWREHVEAQRAGHAGLLEYRLHMEADRREHQRLDANGQRKGPEGPGSARLGQRELARNLGFGVGVQFDRFPIGLQPAGIGIVAEEQKHERGADHGHSNSHQQPGPGPADGFDGVVERLWSQRKTVGRCRADNAAGEPPVAVEPFHDHVARRHGQDALAAEAQQEKQHSEKYKNRVARRQQTAQRRKDRFAPAQQDQDDSKDEAGAKAHPSRSDPIEQFSRMREQERAGKRPAKIGIGQIDPVDAERFHQGFDERRNTGGLARRAQQYADHAPQQDHPSVEEGPAGGIEGNLFEGFH